MHSPPLPVILGEDLHEHLMSLRESPLTVNPPGWQIDWQHGPWPVKVYTGGVRIALGVSPLGRLLFGTFGVSRVRFDPRGGLPPTPEHPVQEHHGSPFVLRRPIPSGGAMYPAEAYLVLPGPGTAYHYDPFRHELVDLGRPRVTELVCDALAQPGPLPSVLLVVTDRFAKNFHKYGDFALRLGAVDVGVAVGRAIRLARAAFGPIRWHLSFADDQVDRCLGLDGRVEAAYAVLAFDAEIPAVVTGHAACRPSEIERSRHTQWSERLDAAHAAARVLDRPDGLGEPPPPESGPPEEAGLPVRLPAGRAVDLLDDEVMLRRGSHGMRFTGGEADRAELATVLSSAVEALTVARRAAGDLLGRDIELYCAVHRVSAMPSGWYRYRPGEHDLQPVGAGVTDGSAAELQEALFSASLNVELSAFTVHVAGARDYRNADRGARGYREQQMAVGVAVEAVTLAATGVGLSGHPVLGYDAVRVDARYGLTGTGRATHAQVSVGVARSEAQWEVTVRPR
jgi:SagB-type dehydrogenase family enzyme